MLILRQWTDPALPPGMTAEKIHVGVKLALADFAARGWHPENCFISSDETAVPTVERRLAGDLYDCVVLGAGVRLPPSRLGLFELWSTPSIVPRRASSRCLQHQPEDSGAAAAR